MSRSSHLGRDSFEDMERAIRELLTKVPAGISFDPARSVEGITCNRPSQGLTDACMRPWDALWPDGPLPIRTAR